MNKPTSQTLLAWCVTAITLLMTSANGWAQQPSQPGLDKPVRELRVPFDNLDALLGPGTDRVLTTRAEFAALTKAAKIDPAEKLPHEQALIQADYQINLLDGRAVMRGDLVFDLLKDQPQIVALPLQSLGLRTALLDGKPAVMAQQAGQEQQARQEQQAGQEQASNIQCLMDGAGTKTLSLEMISAVQTDAAQQTIQFGVPIASSSNIQITVNGNVEIKSGARVIRRNYLADSNQTQFQIVPTKEMMTITMSLNNKQRRDQDTVLGRAVLISEVTAEAELLHASLAMDIVNGSRQSFEFRLDESLDVEAVTCQGLSRWEVETIDEQPHLVVTFQEPAIDRKVISVRMIRKSPGLTDWNFPTFQPRELAGYTAVIGIVAETRLQASNLSPQSMYAIDSELLNVAAPQSLLNRQPGQAELQAITAYYAPQAGYALSSDFVLPEPELEVDANTLFTFSDAGVTAAGGITLQPMHQTLFNFEFVVPQDWDLQWVRDGVNAELQFERFTEPTGTRVRVRLRKGLASTEATTVWFEAKHVPPNWFADWNTQSLLLPSFPVSNSDVHRGVLSIKPIDDLEATATQLTNLVLDKDAQGATVRSTLTEDNRVLDSFRYEADDWQAAVEVTRATPRSTARIMNFVRIGTEAWTVHNELIFLVEQARTATLQFSLPGNSPEEVLIGALDGVGIKESTSEVIDDRRVWTVVLDQPRSGSIRLTVDYTQNAEQDNIENVTLPTARALGSEYQTGAIAVEGDADLETTIQESPRGIDIGEVFDAEYQLGNRLIGVYGYVAEEDQVVVSIKRRAIEAMPATIVQRAEIVAQVSTHGRCQCAARFALKTKSSQIEVLLPKDASLWAVLLGGKPALAQGDDGQILIAMPADVTNPLRDLQVVYEMPVKSIMLGGKMRLQGPSLAERSTPSQTSQDQPGTDTAKLQTIPVANLKWEVYLPQGYQVTTIDGRLLEQESSTSTSPLGGFLAKAYLLGGAEQAATIRDAMPRPAMGLARHDAAVFNDAEMATEEESEMSDFGGEGNDPFDQPTEMPAMEAPNAPAADPFGDALPAPVAKSANRSSVRRPQSGVQATQPATVSQPAAPPAPGGFGGGQQAADAAKTQLLGINRSWAMESLRCLPIDLSAIELQQSIQWTSLGNRNEVEVIVLHRSRYQGIVALIGLIAVFGGLTRKTFTQRLVYLVLLVALSLIVPVAMGAATQWQWTQAALLAAAVGLLILYQCQSLCKAIGARATQLKTSSAKLVKRFTKRSVSKAAATLLVLCTLTSGQPAAFGQDSPGPNLEAINPQPSLFAPMTVGNDKQWDGLMKAIQAMQPSQGTVAIPDDAIVVPYDPDPPNRPEDTDTLLVPAKLYQQLLQISHQQSEPKDAPSPLSVAWSDVSYTMTIGGDQTLEIIGKLRLRQFAKKPMGIPLALSGCVIEQATLSGQPARLRAIRPRPPIVMKQAEMKQQAVPANNSVQVDSQQLQVPGPGNELMILYTDGPGEHELVIKLRLGLEKSGGWRIAEAVLPPAPAAALSIRVPNQDTEVFLDGKLDRNDYLTQQANEVLQTSLASDGKLRLRWRDKITEADVDQGLVVGTDAVFDVQEDMTRLVWKGTFAFRRGQRESFSMDVPNGYLVQKVLGDNVRGWAIQPKETTQQLNIELLKAAVDKETLTVIISAQHAILEGQSAGIEVPNLIVPDAMLQQGQLLVRSSSLLKTRSGVAEGLGRVDIPTDFAWFAPYNDNGPLPLQNFQAYRYARPRYRLPINVDAIPVKASATVQSVLRLSERSSRFESRIRITAKDRPLFVVQCLLPVGLEINPPQYSGAFQWALVKQDNGQSRLDLFLADGELGQFDIVIDGTMPLAVGQATQANPMAIDLPNVDVLNMDRQNGQLAFQIDPAYDMTTTALQNCQRLNLNAINSWLSGRQRQLARLVLGYQNNNYSGQVRVTPRTPRVSTWLVSNIKVTDRALEETIYIEANITSAGIDQYQFTLPNRLAKARIEAPGLRRKTVEPIADSARVRVTLDLQEAIMGQFAIIVQNDRLLGQGSQDSPIAVIETGQTSASYITLENASRDELLTDQRVSVEELEQSELAKIARLSRLAEKASMVFRIRSNQDDAPLLTYQTKTRGVIETSGARIGLAQTVLVVDQYGAYRATQEYRVQNRTEPFLAVQIPAGSALWTVQVAGESVKPSRNASGDMLIPLIKTAEGDLDYAVILKYGGQINRPGKFSNVAFPLMKTVNINVERSQVRLRLPKDMQWFDFQGTLGQVGDDNELIAGVVEYRTEQIAKMTQLLGSKKGEYTKARAQNNLKLLNAESQAFNDQIRDNRDLQEQIANNTIAIQQAEQQLQDFEDSNKNADAQFSNRLAIDEFFREQRNGRSLNVASSLGNNFSVPVESSKPSGKIVGDFAVAPQQSTNRFGTKWFADNDLSNADTGEIAEYKKRDVQASKGQSLSRQFKQPARKSVQTRNNAPVAKNGAMIADEKSSEVVQLKDLQKKLEVQQQISGDYRAQVDRYSRQLESQQLQRGAVTLSQNAAAPNTNGIGLDFSGLMAQSGLQPQQQAGQALAPLNYLNNANPGFLGSLDIDMPAGDDETTTEFLFTTPGGDLELSARSVSMQDQLRLISVAAVLIGLLVILFASRVIRALRGSAVLRMIGAVLMVVIGLGSLVNNTLPLFGLLLIIAAATSLITPKLVATHS